MYSPLKASRRSFCKYSALAIASLLTSVGCRQQTNTAGNAAPSPTLKIGLNLWAGFMPWQVAKEKDFFKANNLNAEIIWFPVLSDQITAFNAGKIDVIGITLYDFITSASNGVKSKIISITDMSYLFFSLSSLPFGISSHLARILFHFSYFWLCSIYFLLHAFGFVDMRTT